MNHLRHQTLGRLLRGARIRAGIGLREFAAKVNKSASWVSKVERETEQPSSATLRVLCRELKVPYDDAVYMARDAEAIGAALLRIDGAVRNGHIKGVTLHLTYAGGYYCLFENYDGVIVKSDASAGVIGAIENAEKKYDEFRQLERMAL